MIKEILLLLVLSFIPFVTHADEYDLAVEAYNSGDYAKAFPIYEKLALAGDVDAQSDLGIMYAQGYGVPKNINEAVKWWTKAADMGQNKAQGYLGGIYSSETSGLLNYKKAFKYYSLSAKQNDAISQSILGFMYAEGQGVEKDINKAIELWHKSAKAGNEDAIKNLNHARELGLIE
ncbi:MAG: tetratricopeptide repeat protein [Pseudomonadales bacterium]